MKTLESNPKLVSMKQEFNAIRIEQKAKYEKEKAYLKATIELVSQGYQYDAILSVENVVNYVKSMGYAYYFVNNDNKITDFGKPRFSHRFKMDKKRFIVQIGVAQHILPELMRKFAADVPTGILVMKKGGKNKKNEAKTK